MLYNIYSRALCYSGKCAYTAKVSKNEVSICASNSYEPNTHVNFKLFKFIYFLLLALLLGEDLPNMVFSGTQVWL